MEEETSKNEMVTRREFEEFKELPFGEVLERLAKLEAALGKNRIEAVAKAREMLDESINLAKILQEIIHHTLCATEAHSEECSDLACEDGGNRTVIRRIPQGPVPTLTKAL